MNAVEVSGVADIDAEPPVSYPELHLQPHNLPALRLRWN